MQTGTVRPGAFAPHPLLRNPHLQTIVPVLRSTPRLELQIERRETSDGDFVDIGWAGERDGSGPICVMLHGLGGGFEAKYARGLALNLLPQGWRCVFLQFRGAGPEPNRLRRSYHHGDTQDLRELIAWLHEREPDTRLHAVGWSLGGNVLLKYLGEEGTAAPLANAVSVCPPFQLRPCAERLRTGFSRIYQAHLLKELKALIRNKNRAVPLSLDMAAVERARDFFEFDNFATARINGFRDAEDYYAQCSSGGYLAGIRVPTLIIHSTDDPFMSPSIMPRAHDLPAGVTLELCERGGHVGFIAAGPGLAPRWWLEDRIPDFLAER